jgi:hypothetical protein
VRLALPYLRERGWEPTVLCADATTVLAPRDELLQDSISPDIPVYRVPAYSERWTRFLAVGSLALRSYHRMSKMGEQLLKNHSFDLVFFSTTEFGLLPLGPKWQQQFGIPYVVDLQDPWVNEYYRNQGIRPPGGVVKHAIHQWFARRFEPHVIQNAGAVMVVSPHYIAALCQRYSYLDRNRFVTIPFATTLKDLEIACSSRVINRQFDRGDGIEHWVYVGRCGPDMDHSLRSILTAVKKFRESKSNISQGLRLHFIGTDYASNGTGKFWVKPIAGEMGISDLVVETPSRIPYFEALRCLVDSNAMIVPGSSDPSYTASKIYPYIATRKPLLTVFHEQSSVNALMARVGGGISIRFSSNTSSEETGTEIYERWIATNAYKNVSEIDNASFSEYLAPAMTDRIVDCFSIALGQR